MSAWEVAGFSVKDLHRLAHGKADANLLIRLKRLFAGV